MQIFHLRSMKVGTSLKVIEAWIIKNQQLCATAIANNITWLLLDKNQR